MRWSQRLGLDGVSNQLPKCPRSHSWDEKVEIRTISRILRDMRYLDKHLVRFWGWDLDVLFREVWGLAVRDADDDGCVRFVSGHFVVVFRYFNKLISR